MPLSFISGDITQIRADAIVNAAKNTLLGGGGVDGAIHRAAGPGLLAECRTLGGCETGEAKITRGYDLPAKYVIHTVGPVWHGGGRGEEKLLRSCYASCMRLAKEYGLTSIAFPLISAGAYGYPKAEAIRIACEEISSLPETADVDVTIVFYDRPESSDEELKRRLRLYRAPFDSESASLYGFYGMQESAPLPCFSADEAPLEKIPPVEKKKAKALMPGKASKPYKTPIAGGFARMSAGKADELQDLIKGSDVTFSDMLLKLIDEKGMTDSECYKKANISRKHFSKIRCDSKYRPEKKTVLAFAVALKLTPAETEDLLHKAGFAFIDWDAFDIIVKYYIEKGEYDIFRINETLFEYDQPLLGSAAL